MLPPAPQDIPGLYKRALALQAEGRLPEALALLDRILLARPNTAEALFQKGRIVASQGQAEKAEGALRKALVLKPKEPAIWQALFAVLSGGAAKKLAREATRAGIPLGSEMEVRPILDGIPRDAEAAEARALALVKRAPAAFWPALALGRARAEQGKWAAALGPLEKAHERDPDHAEAQIALGTCLGELDQPLRAEALLAPHTPRSVVASRALARIYLKTLRPEDSAALLHQTQAKPPRAGAIWRERAVAHAACGAVAPARAALREAAKQGQSGSGPIHAVAQRLQEAGEANAAREVMQEAVAGAPDDPALRTHLAQMLQSDGDIAGAAGHLRRVLDADPGFAEAYRAYFAGGKASEDDPLFAQMMAQVARPDLPTSARRILGFAAAKALGDVGRHAEVFAHLHRANRLMTQSFPYGFDADLQEARALVADWPALRDLPVDGPEDPVFFVTGLPRSGTTLVETILASHSQVSAGGELPFLNRALAPVMEELRGGNIAPQRLATAGNRYLRAARRKAGGVIFTDKAISTFSRIGHAARMLPGAKFIVLRRDPRDVGLSLYRNMFPEGTHRYASDLAAMGRYIKLHDAMVAFWAEALPDRVHIVDYEQLTADPEPVIRGLIAFSGLPWEDACLRPEQADRRIDTLSFSQARQPIGRASVAGWRRFEAELQPLSVALAGPPVDLASGA